MRSTRVYSSGPSSPARSSGSAATTRWATSSSASARVARSHDLLLVQHAVALARTERALEQRPLAQRVAELPVEEHQRRLPRAVHLAQVALDHDVAPRARAGSWRA